LRRPINRGGELRDIGPDGVRVQHHEDERAALAGPVLEGQCGRKICPTCGYDSFTDGDHRRIGQEVFDPVSKADCHAVGAGWGGRGVCAECKGRGVVPCGRDPVADLQLYHRWLAYVALGLVVWLTIEAFRTQRQVAGLVKTSVVLLGMTVLDAAIGALAVSSDVPPLSEVAHTGTTSLTWSAAVALVVIAHRGASLPLAPGSSPILAGAWRISPRMLAAYVQLTKPRVMSLLLATTAAAMVIAARGLPNIGLLIATLVGGALMAGGAGAINHYVDRDIDPLMGRTAWRPIPSGVIAPRHALWFGIGLAALAILRNEHDAEDAAQEAMLKAFANIRQFRAEARLSTWLIQITVNQALMRWLRQRTIVMEAIDDHRDQADE